MSDTVELADQPALHVGSGTERGKNTTVITDEGFELGVEHFREVSPATHPMIVELAVNMARSDWSSGNEERSMKGLREHMDLAGANRVIAAMLSAS